MRRLGLAVVLALGGASAALAQVSTTGSAQLNDSNGPNSSVVQPGIAKPPAGAPTQMPSGMSPNMAMPPNMANNPTSPQIALQPSTKVGSPVPIAGAGGTSSAPVGKNQHEFFITHLFRQFFNQF